MKRVSGPSAPASTRATILSTRLQLAGPVEELLEAARLCLPSARPQSPRLRAGFEVLDVPAQCRGRRDAENVFEPLGTTEVENLGTAIMAVATQHYLRFRPVGADGAQQPVQEGANLLAARPFGGTKNGGDEETGPRHRTRRSAESRIRRNAR